jgi:hypothetical protein
MSNPADLKTQTPPKARPKYIFLATNGLLHIQSASAIGPYVIPLLQTVKRTNKTQLQSTPKWPFLRLFLIILGHTQGKIQTFSLIFFHSYLFHPKTFS